MPCFSKVGHVRFSCRSSLLSSYFGSTHFLNTGVSFVLAGGVLLCPLNGSGLESRR